MKSPYKKSLGSRSLNVAPLEPPTGRSTGNFTEWKMQIQADPDITSVLGKGMIIFRTGEKATPKPVTEAMWNPVLPVPENGDPHAALPAAIITKRRESAYTRFDNELADIEKNLEASFYMVWSTLSQESKNKVENLAGEEWLAINTDCDTHRLLQLITESHLTMAFGDW